MPPEASGSQQEFDRAQKRRRTLADLAPIENEMATTVRDEGGPKSELTLYYQQSRGGLGMCCC